MQYLVVLLALVVSQGSVASSHKNDLLQAWNESLHKWQSIKSKHPSYQYTTQFSSWTGYSSETRVQVRNGKIYARGFMEMNSRQTPNQQTSGRMYLEIGKQIGSNDFGAPAKTLDDIYMQCGLEWLQKDALDNRLYFTTDKNGILNTCGYRHKQCSDDCFRGASISSLELE